MGQLVSTKKPFRGHYEPLANDEDELLETPAESCAIILEEGDSLRRASSDDVSVVAKGGTQNTANRLESLQNLSTKPLSVVATATATGKRKNDLSSATMGGVGEFHGIKETVLLEQGGSLVRVTECTNCGNRCSDSMPQGRLRRSRSMQW